MNIRKDTNTSEANLFGIKIFEQIVETVEVFDHEFKDDNEEQDVLAQKIVITRKVFGVPFLKITSANDPNNLIPKDEKSKLQLPLSSLCKNLLIVSGFLIALVSVFISGIYVANSEWFNNTFYIESRQMQNLNIKGVKQYDKALAIADYNVDRSNILGSKRDYYHNYYEKVVERIKNLDLDDSEKKVLFDYINKYPQRKREMENVLFPRLNNTSAEASYGTLIGVTYPSGMMEFDRIELLTLRMILYKMYDSFSISDINTIFKE